MRIKLRTFLESGTCSPIETRSILIDHILESIFICVNFIFGWFLICSIDGKYLVSVGSGCPCKVWDVTSSEAVAALPQQNVRFITLLFCFKL